MLARKGLENVDTGWSYDIKLCHMTHVVLNCVIALCHTPPGLLDYIIWHVRNLTLSYHTMRNLCYWIVSYETCVIHCCTWNMCHETVSCNIRVFYCVLWYVIKLYYMIHVCHCIVSYDLCVIASCHMTRVSLHSVIRLVCHCIVSHDTCIIMNMLTRSLERICNPSYLWVVW